MRRLGIWPGAGRDPRSTGAPSLRFKVPTLHAEGALLPLAIAAAVALALSSQYFIQPFIWEHWSLGDILLGWTDVVRDRLLVALSVAAVLVLARPRRVAGWRHTAWMLGALTAGAALGEGLAALFDPGMSGAQRLGHVLHWAIMGGAIVTMFGLWTDAHRQAQALASASLQRLRLQHRTQELRLLLLRQQIAPHFLFNTLATVKHLGNEDPQRGAALLADLITYLDAAADQGVQGAQARLAREIDMTQAYLRVVATRFQSRLDFELDVPPPLLDAAFPSFVLVTLVENAVKHGILPAPLGGRICIVARRLDAQLRLEVRDDGVGFSGVLGSGVGLANIRATLDALYGEQAELSLEAGSPRGVTAVVTLPWKAMP